MKKILITGINGMLGQCICEKISVLTDFEVYGIGRSKSIFSNLKGYFEGDLRNEDFIKELSEVDYDFIIHCAAIVNLKFCESDHELARQTHVAASRNLALQNPHAIFIYISTDSVFDGNLGGYSENNPVKPLNYYALTKYLGEVALTEIHDLLYIFRLNIYGFKKPFGSSLFEWGFNALKNDKPISGYDNIIFNPLYIEQVADVILNFMNKNPAFGLYHLGSQEKLSKYDFLIKIADSFNLNKYLITKTSVDFKNSIIRRPLNTTLNIGKLKNTFPNLKLSIGEGFNNLVKKINKNK